MEQKFPFCISREGEKITFIGIAFINGVEVLQTELEVEPNAGPPMHTHHRQDEGFTILCGTMGYEILGQEVKYAYPGETIVIKAGLPHKFWNAGKDLMKCKGFVTPPENYAYFLSELYKSINKNNGRPGMYDGAFLLKRYKSEFAMLDIPSFVQKFIFPIVLFFGNLMGKQKKFSNAPGSSL